MSKRFPLIFETLEDEKNCLYLTLIEYKRVRYLTIVENLVNNEIHAYILDNLEAEGIDQDWFMGIATKWFYSASDRYPLSFEFSKLGYGDVVKKTLKTFNINATSRIIGKIFSYDIDSKPKIKRRKVVSVACVNEIKFKD